MNKRKWTGAVLSAMMVISMLVFPGFSSAQGNINLDGQRKRAKQIKTKQMLQHFASKREKQRRDAVHSKSGASLLDVNEVDFSDKIDSYHWHVYHLTVSEAGTIQVNSNGTPSKVMYDIFPWNPEDEKVYHHGDTLPAGEYDFVVQYNDIEFDPTETDFNYDFTVNGVQMTVDNNVPTVETTSPATHNVHLAKGTTSVTFAGSVSGANNAGISMGSQGKGVIEVSTSAPYSKDIPVQAGYNFATLTASEWSSNMAIEFFKIKVSGMKRIAGADRYEVSANISRLLQDTYPFPTDTVVIARGDLYTDALSGGALASFYGAPILLTGTNALPEKIKQEIEVMMYSHAIILGGTGSVSTNVENQLKAMGLTTERYDGANRFAVSAKIAGKISKVTGTDTAFIASGLNFPDALSASSPSGQMMMPILLVSKDYVPAEIDAFIKSHPNVKQFIIVGGPGTVSDAVATKIASYSHVGKDNVYRVGGANRFEVGVNLVDFFGLTYQQYGFMDPHTLVFANGLDFPDALSGGPLAAKLYAPIMLSYPTRLDGKVNEFLNANENEVIYILGGTGSVSTTVEQQLNAKIQ